MQFLLDRVIKPLSGKNRRWFLWLGIPGFVGLIGLIVALVWSARSPAETKVGFSELTRIADSGDVTSVRMEQEYVHVRMASGRAMVAVVGDEGARHDLVKRLGERQIPLTFDAKESSGIVVVLENATPVLLIVLLVGGALLLQNSRGKRHFSVGASSKSAIVRFADVAGMDDVKESLEETVAFLKNPALYGRLGGRAPRGILLTGDPGTGKTLLARAASNEAGVPFLSCSGSSFQEMYVGVGASRVRKLFKEARSLAPCIVFIDEIDAIGRARGKGGDGASNEHEQTINQLLVEMDGFDHTSGIVVMASTNRPDVLDPAVVRPGRFDRQLTIPLPDFRGRQEILAVHAKSIDLHDEVDLAHVARQTPGFSGAELANLLNEAAILATRDDAVTVDNDHVERARDRLLMGAERKGLLLDPVERHATAVHEAGHVAVSIVAEHTDPVHKVSILPRGRTLGVTASLPEKDRLMYDKRYLEDQICMLLGGRAAEIEVLGTMTAGASDDIQRATNVARKMVAELGMSAVGPICLKADAGLPHSQKLLDTVEETTRSILETQLERACAIVAARKTQVTDLVNALLEHDTLNRREILACFPADASSLASQS